MNDKDAFSADENFHTTDTALAAFLTCKGIQLKGVYRDDSGLVTFIFSQPDESLLAEFHSDSGTVHAQAYHRAYKSMLKLVHGRGLPVLSDKR